MTTMAEVGEAHAGSQSQRFAMRQLLKVKFSRAKPADTDMIERVGAVATAQEYDRILADPAVVDLFRRQVLYFGDAR